MPVATLYPHMDQIGGVGGPWTLEGVDLGGDLVGGFGIGDMDVTIWGLYGVGPLALLWCQGSHGVFPYIDIPICSSDLDPSWSRLEIQCPSGFVSCLSGLVSVSHHSNSHQVTYSVKLTLSHTTTAPHGSEADIIVCSIFFILSRVYISQPGSQG